MAEILLPVRVELKCETNNTFCNFTIVDVPFAVEPVRNDPIGFQYDGWPKQVVTIIQYVYHIVGNKPGSVVCCSCSFAEYDDMIAAFDQFKDAVQITDQDAGGARPPNYYVAFRLLIKLWGKKEFVCELDHPTALAELIRAMYLAGNDKADVTNSNPLIELVHKLIIESKQRQHGGPINLFKLMQELDKSAHCCSYLSAGDAAAVVDIAKKLFATIRSVPPEKLPICVK